VLEMARDENSKVTFYADADIRDELERLGSGTKSHTINSLLRKGFENRRKQMYDKAIHDFCSEFYSVEKTVEVVVNRNGQTSTVRLEALRDEENGHYCTRAYIEEAVTLQPTYPQSMGKFERKSEDFRIMVPFPDFPWVNSDTAESALRQSLGFLKERCTVLSRA
jgi:hypothetical protein